MVNSNDSGRNNNFGTIKNKGSFGGFGNVNYAEGSGPHDNDLGRTTTSDRPAAEPDLNLIFLSSNCEGARLDLDREFNRIHQHVSNTDPAWARCIEYWPDVSLDQLATRVMRSSKPTILHFGGHADRQGGIVLRDHRGDPIHVNPEGLCRLLHQFASKIRMVVLNACFSVAVAKNLAKSIEIVIGMKDAIEDESAILFSQSFYEGLAMNLPVDTAFGVACSLILAQSAQAEDVPVLLSSDRVDPSILTFGRPG